jgi:hypothetical protein
MVGLQRESISTGKKSGRKNESEHITLHDCMIFQTRDAQILIFLHARLCMGWNVLDWRVHENG